MQGLCGQDEIENDADGTRRHTPVRAFDDVEALAQRLIAEASAEDPEFEQHYKDWLEAQS